MKNILILSGRANVSLHITKILYKNGYNVFIVDFVDFFLCKKSKYIKKSFKITAPNKNIDDFILGINKITKENSIDLIIPTCEEVFYLSKYKDKINANILVDNIEKLLILHNKYKFIKFCENIGINVPKTILIKNGKLPKIKGKAILKPIFSRFGTNVFLLNKNSNIKINKNKDYVLQQYLKGEEICSYSIAKNGEILIHTNYKMKYKAFNSVSIFYEYFENKEIEKIVKKIVKELNFTGQISFDFIMTEKGVFPIECNPRATSGLNLIPYNIDILDIFLKNKNVKIENYNIEAEKAILFIKGVFFLKFIKKEFRNDFKKAKDTTFDLKDTKPLFYKTISLIYFYILSLKNKTNLRNALTLDLEFNNEV